MTGVILSVLWTLAMIPLAILLRMIGKRVMDVTYRTSVDTYWETRTDAMNDFKLLERQY